MKHSIHLAFHLPSVWRVPPHSLFPFLTCFLPYPLPSPSLRLSLTFPSSAPFPHLLSSEELSLFLFPLPLCINPLTPPSPSTHPFSPFTCLSFLYLPSASSPLPIPSVPLPAFPLLTFPPSPHLPSLPSPFLPPPSLSHSSPGGTSNRKPLKSLPIMPIIIFNCFGNCNGIFFFFS